MHLSMTENNPAGLIDMGSQGIVIGALFAFIYFLVKEHRAERQEWLTAYSVQCKILDDRQRETNAVLREMSAIVRESRAHLSNHS